MNEVTEMYKDWRKMKQTASAQRRENAPEMLDKAGVSFTEHNNGAHLIIESHLGYTDFWPGTGKWKTRGTFAITGFGIKTLLEYIDPRFTHG